MIDKPTLFENMTNPPPQICGGGLFVRIWGKGQVCQAVIR